MSAAPSPASAWQSRVIMLLLGLLTSVLATVAGYGWTELQANQGSLALVGERLAVNETTVVGTIARLDRIESKIDRLGERIDAVAARPPTPVLRR